MRVRSPPLVVEDASPVRTDRAVFYLSVGAARGNDPLTKVCVKSRGTEAGSALPSTGVDDKTNRRNPVEDAYRRYRGQIYRYLLRRTGSTDAAEELTQRVFTDAAAALSDNRPDSVLAWLYAVAERRFIDEARRHRRHIDQLEASANPAAREGTLEYQREIARALNEEIKALPAEQRKIVVMKLLQGRSFAEIAEAMGASVDACKMRFSRAIRRLRDQLEERGITP
jgi:RNA polymerase sigma-70 factor (ECF subfamily)